ALPIGLAALATWPGRAALRDTAWPAAPDRRLVVLAFALPLVLPTLLAVVAHEQVISLWSIGSMTLLPVVLLSSPSVILPEVAVRRILALAIAFPLISLPLSRSGGAGIHPAGVPECGTRA